MKTISRYIMTLALLITAVGGAWAQTQWESGDCTVTLNNGTLTVSGNGGMAAYLNLSDRPWDGNSGDITSVVVESGVTSLGFNAFSCFSTMTSVTLPEGLTAIGPNAFNSCSSLQSITIPSTVTSISEGAFFGCSAMTSVTLPEGLTAIGALTFSECSSLTSVTIPSTVTSIVDGAFMGCSAITSVTLPEGLTTIGAAAFMNCSSLTSVTIPSTVTSIAEYAFMSSSAISDVNLYANPDNLTWGDASNDFKQSKATQCHVLAEHLSTYQNNFSSVNVTFVGDLEPLPTSDVEVTTNAAEEGATFTEATFAMPAFDATAEYELVRDMGYKVAFSGVPTRARLAKDGDGKFHFADGLTFQLLDNIDAANPKDITSAEGITFMVGEVDAVDIEGSTFYQLDKETLVPLADFLADAHLGNYAICAVASTGEYDGTVYSSEFTAVEEYDLTVKPANDFSKGKIDAVTVGSGSVTIDANTGEATKTGIAPETEVKIKAKRGYVIDKVEVKKGGAAAAKTITIGDMELTYADGDTWETIVSKNSDKIKTLAGGYIVQVAQPEPNKYRYIKVVLSNKVNPSDIIDPSKNYEWGTIEVYS